jgi:hypothetical protein
MKNLEFIKTKNNKINSNSLIKNNNNLTTYKNSLNLYNTRDTLNSLKYKKNINMFDTYSNLNVEEFEDVNYTLKLGFNDHLESSKNINKYIIPELNDNCIEDNLTLFENNKFGLLDISKFKNNKINTIKNEFKFKKNNHTNDKNLNFKIPVEIPKIENSNVIDLLFEFEPFADYYDCDYFFNNNSNNVYEIMYPIKNINEYENTNNSVDSINQSYKYLKKEHKLNDYYDYENINNEKYITNLLNIDKSSNLLINFTDSDTDLTDYLKLVKIDLKLKNNELNNSIKLKKKNNIITNFLNKQKITIKKLNNIFINYNKTSKIKKESIINTKNIFILENKNIYKNNKYYNFLIGNNNKNMD